jgi:hypothetical protein
LEGMLFTAGLVAAMMIGLRRMRPPA